MNNQENTFYRFLNLTRGNWRNAVFVYCKRQCDIKCRGYLMIPDTECVPTLYAVADFEEKSNEIIDKSECAACISVETFENIYDRWLLWNITDKKKCNIIQIIQ